MNLDLHGVHVVKKRLATGEVRTYHYAFRGGPRIDGKPGSAEFLRSYQDALADLAQDGRKDTLSSLVDTYLDSSDFTAKAPRTQRDYRRLLAAIEAKFGGLSFRTLNDQRTRATFMKWRDGLAAKPRTADAMWTMLATVLSFAYKRGILDRNVCAGGGHLYKSDRAELVWAEAEIAAVLAVAPIHVADVLLFALWTGQRQGDALGWKWDGLRDGRLVKRTNKRGAFVAIPVGGPLAAVLDRRSAARSAETILTTSRGSPWTSDGFRASWGKTVETAGVKGRTFNDLRGTAVTRLALAGCNEAEIASITGHSMSTVSQLLDAHYLGGRAELAEQAMGKLAGRYGGT